MINEKNPMHNDFPLKNHRERTIALALQRKYKT